ncbi:MAG: carbon-nitrogen hydrolase family protein [Clostridia bacterium]|nr:carbon-nitrogen hydrolase family protein [Clostridia bacterium]
MGKKALVASFGLNEDFLRGKTQEEIVPVIVDKIESVRGYEPDLIVLPEAFLKIGGDRLNPRWRGITNDMLGELKRLARELSCYIAAPLYEPYPGSDTLRYNTTFLLDRAGEAVGRYRKVHTVYEESTVSMVVPGCDYPVFDTDFGRIGFQTCFDIGWRDGWKALADKGAKLVVWTAAYDGGNLLNTYAAHNMYYVVSSVRTDHAQIIDLTGRAIAEGARWNGLAMARVDLETQLYHIDRQYQKIDVIRKALGSKVTIRAYSEENVFTVESNDPAWPIERIEREFGLMNYKDYHAEAARLQEEWRAKYPSLPGEG